MSVSLPWPYDEVGAGAYAQENGLGVEGAVPRASAPVQREERDRGRAVERLYGQGECLKY